MLSHVNFPTPFVSKKDALKTKLCNFSRFLDAFVRRWIGGVSFKSENSFCEIVLNDKLFEEFVKSLNNSWVNTRASSPRKFLGARHRVTKDIRYFNVYPETSVIGAHTDYALGERCISSFLDSNSSRSKNGINWV